MQKVIRLEETPAPAVVAWTVPILLLVLFLYVGNYFPQLYGSVLVWWHVILAGVGGVAVWAALRGQLASLGRFGNVLAGSALAVALATSLTAVDSPRSLTNAWLLSGYVAVFWLALSGVRRWGHRWLVWALATGAIGLAMLGMVIDATGSTYAGFDVRSVPRFTFPLGNKNFTASFFLLAWPFLIGAAQGEREALPRYTLYGGAALSLFCLFGSESRGAYLAAAVQLIMLGVLLAGPMKRAIGQLSGKVWAALAAGLLVVGIGVSATTDVGERVASIGRVAREVVSGGYVSDNSAAMRIEMWRGALQGFGSRALIGHGLGSVPTQFPADRIQSPRYPDVVNPQLHSTPFHLLYEVGIAGVLLLLGIAAFILWSLVRVVRHSEPHPAAIGVGIGLLGYGFSLLTDFHWEVPSLSVTFALAAALLVAASRPDEAAAPETPGLSPRAVAGGLLGLVVLGGGVTMLATKDQGALAYDRGYTYLVRSEYQPGIEAWRQAVQLDPTTPFYRVALGATLHYLTSDQADSPEVRKLREEALALFGGQTDTVHLALAKIKQGILHTKLGQPDKAIAPLQEAARLTYYAPVPHYFLGQAYLEAGDEAKAIKAFGTALAFSPAMQWASVWQTADGARLQAAVAEEALAIYRRQGVSDDWLTQHQGMLLVMAGKRADAEAALKPLTAPDSPYRALALAWTGEAAFRAKDWQTAAGQFEAALTADATLGFAKVRLAQAKHQLGDSSQVAAGLQALAAVYGSGATEAMIQDPAAMAKASIPIGFDTRKGWANMAYRRTAPDQPFPNPIPLTPEGMFFLGDEKPWPGFPRVTYRQLAAAAQGDVAPELAKLPL